MREFSSKQRAIGSTTSGSAATSSILKPGLILKVESIFSGGVGGIRGRSAAATSGSAAGEGIVKNGIARHAKTAQKQGSRRRTTIKREKSNIVNGTSVLYRFKVIFESLFR